MTATAPEFLDLLALSGQSGASVPALIRAWRDGDRRGAHLEWWLADRDALKLSGKERIGAVAQRALEVLSPASA